MVSMTWITPFDWKTIGIVTFSMPPLSPEKIGASSFIPPHRLPVTPS